MRRSSLALRVITSSCAWRLEQHLGQAHGSVQLVLVLCKHRTLGGLAGTILLALPHPPSPQCCHSSSSSWERPSWKRTSEGSHQPHNQLFLPQLVQVEDAQGGKVPHHKRSRTPVGRRRCSPAFNSKVTNRPNCCAVEQQLRELPTSTVAPPRSFPTKQRSDHSAWSSSSPDFRGIAKRNCGGRFSSADVSHQLFSD